MPEQRYPADTIAARGRALFAENVQSRVADRSPQDFVAIDIETGEFSVGATESEAINQLLIRQPAAQAYLRRVGRPFTHRIGFVPASVMPDQTRWKRLERHA